MRMQILKTDVRGRVHVSPQRRGELLAEYDRSGLSGPKHRFKPLDGLAGPLTTGAPDEALEVGTLAQAPIAAALLRAWERTGC
jgi:hypothetical protein